MRIRPKPAIRYALLFFPAYIALSLLIDLVFSELPQDRSDWLSLLWKAVLWSVGLGIVMTVIRRSN